MPTSHGAGKKTKSVLFAGTLVVGFAEEIAGFLIGTLNYLVEDFVLLAVVGCSSVAYVLLWLIYASLFNHIKILIPGAKLPLSLIAFVSTDVDSVMSFRALKLSKSESFRALKLSKSESFRALKLSLFESLG